MSPLDWAKMLLRLGSKLIDLVPGKKSAPKLAEPIDQLETEKATKQVEDARRARKTDAH
jgi:hypothetical protein